MMQKSEELDKGFIPQSFDFRLCLWSSNIVLRLRETEDLWICFGLSLQLRLYIGS